MQPPRLPARLSARFGWQLAAIFAIAGVIFSLPAASAHEWNVHDLIAEKDPRPNNLFSTDYVHQVAGDTVAVFTAPSRWEKDDWLTFATLSTAVAASSVYDHQIKAESQEERSRKKDTFAQNFQNLGSQYSWIIIGGFATYGYWRSDSEATATAGDAITASLIASGLVAPILKFTAGRERPNKTPQTFKFKPFSGNLSFPSGHTTQAFVLATVIAEHYPAWWVQTFAYGSAAMVGYSRIEQNMHFASDVVAGAAIGWSTARMIVHRHRTNPPHGTVHFEVVPVYGSEFTGLMFSKVY